MREDMTSLIERVPAMEQRLGVSFSGLYAYGDDSWVHINGELRLMSGDALADDVEIVANLYDAGGRMLGTMEHIINAEKFFGFESFSLLQDLDDDQPQVTRILIFARKY